MKIIIAVFSKHENELEAMSWRKIRDITLSFTQKLKLFGGGDLIIDSNDDLHSLSLSLNIFSFYP